MIIHLLLMVGIAYVEPHLPEQSPKCMKIDGAWEASGVHGMLKWTWGCLRLFGWFLQTTLNTNTWLHSEGPNRQYPIYQKKTFRGSVCECFSLYFSLIHSRFGPTSIYIPIFPAALLVADGVHVVGPCHVGPQALGCFIGHLDPILQDRHGKPQCRKFYGSEPREC